MPAYDPQPFVRVNGVTWTSDTIENVKITAGRQTVYEQPRAGYAQIVIRTPENVNYPNVNLDEVVEVGVLDTNAAEKILFTGQISDIQVGLSSVGDAGFLVDTTITAVGRLALLNRLAVGGAGYPQELDGQRVERVVGEAIGLDYVEYGDYYGYDTTNVFRTNLVKNPSFEVNTTGWLAFNASFTRITNDGFSGDCSYQLTATATGTGGFFRWTNNATYRIPVTAGDVLTASGYFKNVSGSRNINISIGWYANATTTTLISQTTSTLINPTDWTRKSVTGTAPATATYADIRVQLASSGAIGDSFRIDAFLLETGSTLNPYYDGSLGSTLPVIWNGTPHDSTSDIRNNPLGTYPNAGTQTWATLDPYLTTFDTGDYDVLAYSSGEANAYQLASAAAQSGIGVVYETADNRIGYKDAESRTLETTFLELPADVILASGIQAAERLGEIANDITINYGSNQSTQDENAGSIAVYGRLKGVVNTILADLDSADAILQYYLDTRSVPRRSLESLVVALHLDNMQNNLRDDLLNVEVGTAIETIALPAAIYPDRFSGFIEGWTWTITRNTLFLQLNVSEYLFSVLAQQWGQVNDTEQWDTINATLEWQEARVVS